MSIQFDVLEAIVPDAVESLKNRYKLLESIASRQPVGRRQLAVVCDMTERHVRSETEILASGGLVAIDKIGITVTEKGISVMKMLEGVMRDFMGLRLKEEKLAELLSINKVIISKGNIGEDKSSMTLLGRTAAVFIDSIISDNDMIAVTGGSTLRCVADRFESTSKHEGITVVPGRGGIGTDPEIQSNTIASIFASKLSAKTDILYLPDMLNPRIARTIMQEPNFKKIMTAIKNVNMLIFGIGVADEMAERRDLAKPIIDMIDQRGAVGEAFGYYFNEDGDTVYISHTIGISLEEMKNVEKLVGIAGGAKKAKAIISVMKNIRNSILITDESAADEMLSILQK